MERDGALSMEKVPSRLISALAALPVSFLFIPYAAWRSKMDPWYGVFMRPLLLIFVAWLIALFVPFTYAWIPAFAVIGWQAFGLKAAIDAHRPRSEPVRESWRR